MPKFLVNSDKPPSLSQTMLLSVSCPATARAALLVIAVLLTGRMPVPPPGCQLTTLRLTVSGQPRQLAVEQKLIDESKRRNLDIKIDAIVLSGYGGTGIGISSRCVHPEAAWRLVHSHLSPGGQRLAAKGGRLVPAYRSVVESPEFLDLVPGVNRRVCADTMTPGAAENLCDTSVGTPLAGESQNATNDPQVSGKTLA